MADDVVDAKAKAGNASIVELVDDYGQVCRGAAGATVFDVHVGQDHAHLAAGQPGLAIGPMILAPLVFAGRQGIGDKTTNAVGECLDIGVHPGRTVIFQHHEYLEFFVLAPDMGLLHGSKPMAAGMRAWAAPVCLANGCYRLPLPPPQTMVWAET
ncbi:hypothetical protein D3C78_1298760 [compost metagenome]